jgi:ceramide glucosyltransferase
MAALIGCLYTLFAAAAARRFASRPLRPPLPELPRVSILKPLHGAEPGLCEHLASFLLQDYAAPFELVFGVEDAADPALAAVDTIKVRAEATPFKVVAEPAVNGANPKVSSLVHMAAAASGEVIVLADSDIRVRSDYLRNVVAELAGEGVGAVTCLYRGLPLAGWWSRMAAMGIDYHFLPSVLVGVRLGLAAPCFGSTIAFTTSTLARIGGFAAFLHRLADDYAMGTAVRGLGLKVAIPPLVVDHGCSEETARQLFEHELRWARTIRSLDPLGFAAALITHPLALALMAFAVWPRTLSAGLVAAALACRLALQIEVDRALGRRLAGRLWLPARDLLTFAVFVASFWPGRVRWRDRSYQVAPDGTLRDEGRQP